VNASASTTEAAAPVARRAPASATPSRAAGDAVWRAIDRDALPPPVAEEPAVGRVGRLLRDLRTARRVPAAQLAHRARFVALRALYARMPARPIADARAVARALRAAEPTPALERDAIAPEPIAEIERNAERVARGRFLFLGREADFSDGIRWRDPGASPLWLFQLHYLGALRDLVLTGRARAAGELLESWARVHGARWDAVAWHPYPTSLRLTNLCVAASAAGGFDRVSPEAAPLAAVHAAFLARHLERDLGGNHLLENACALAFASRFLDGRPARDWDATARSLLAREVRRQVLADGAHFELSPMYHVAVLHRLAQVASLLGADDALVVATIAPALRAMVGFLDGILAPDGDIPLVGDSARGFAPPPAAARALAVRIAGEPGAPSEDEVPAAAAARPHVRSARATVRAHRESGLYVLASDRFWCLFDAGRAAPDSLPGHGQADVLSVEVWVDGVRVVCDPGVHEYTGPWRAWGRSTRAHSAVVVDGRDTDEVYASFRIGRRSQVLDVRASHDAVTATVRVAGSDAIVRRSVRLNGTRGERLQIEDEVRAAPGASVESRLHLAPDVGVRVDVTTGLRARIATGGAAVTLHAARRLVAERGAASTRFGELRETVMLVQRAAIAAGRDGRKVRLSTVLAADPAIPRAVRPRTR